MKQERVLAGLFLSGFCSSFVDKKREKTQKRKTARVHRSRNEKFDLNVTPGLNDDENKLDLENPTKEKV